MSGEQREVKIPRKERGIRRETGGGKGEGKKTRKGWEEWWGEGMRREVKGEENKRG